MNKSSEHKPLTNILISTCFGHGGMGMFPYIFYPPFWILLFTAWLTNTAIIAKSATRYRHHGNYIWWNLFTYKFIHRIKDLQSILNSYGLTNPGVWVCAIMIKIAWTLGFNVVPSFFVNFSKGYETGYKETMEALSIFRRVLGKKFCILELNPSCPNSGEDILSNQRNILRLCEAIKREFPYLTLIVKGSIVYPSSFYAQLEETGVDIIHSMNTIPFDVAVKLGISPYEVSPLGEKTKGGYSGNIIMQPAFDYTMSTVVPTATIPLIFGGGVSADNIAMLFNKTALVNKEGDARDTFFAICTAATYNPIKTAKLLWELNQ